FKGFDMVKKLLQNKKEDTGENGRLADEALRLGETVESLIYSNKTPEKKAAPEQQNTGLVSSLLGKNAKGKNRFYISFFIEKGTPMVSPVFILILKSIESIGSLIFCSVTDSDLEGFSGEETRVLEVILSTDIEEAELYTYFALPYVEKINIVDLTRSRLEQNDYCFNDTDDTSYLIFLKVFIKLYDMLFNQPDGLKNNKTQHKKIRSLYNETINAYNKVNNKNRLNAFIRDLKELFSIILEIYEEQREAAEEDYSNIRAQMMKLTERAYNFIKGKHLFKVFQPRTEGFIDRLREFLGMLNKSTTLIILINLSGLEIISEDELKALIDIKNQVRARDIEICIVAQGPNARRIVNIFDSIKRFEEFYLFKSEIEAVLWMLYSQDSFNRILNKVNEIQI
ncbi:MAG TPA: hypothetical protein PLG48_01240, partial [Candidatus Avimonas sp.]|nr:hypothetical protein [Candidatus Avimonas sp.]